MWRRYLFDENVNLKFSYEDFGQIVNYNNFKLLKLNKFLQFYDNKEGINYIINADNSHKFYVIIDGPKKVDPRTVVLPKSMEGEIIGYILYNDYKFNKKMQYNFRLCVDYFLHLFDNFPKSKTFKDYLIAIKTDRSELLSYTRAHYYQLVDVFPSLKELSIERLRELENKKDTKVVYDIYKKDLERT